MSSLMSDASFDFESPLRDCSGDVSSMISFFTTNKSVLDGRFEELDDESDWGEMF